MMPIKWCDQPALLDLIDERESAVLQSNARRTSHDEGQLIHQRGDRGGGAVIVVAGSATIQQRSGSGKIVSATTLARGQHLGDHFLFGNEARTHELVAQDACVIDRIARDSFRSIVDSEPGIARALHRIAIWRLSMAMELYDDLRMLSGELLLAKYLLRMRLGDAASGVVPIRQAQFAHALGLSNVSVAKQLARLMQDGLVRTGYGRIDVPNWEALGRWVADRDYG